MKVLLSIVVASALAGCSPSAPETSAANQKYLEANALIAQGDREAAVKALNESIAAEPTLWSYRSRARLYAEMGQDDEARADCEAGLKITPGDADLLWIKGELAKPVGRRFKGPPPSANR